ncbi:MULTISPECIES: hypothetical protein [Pseudomonadaceae]|jgi:hypothetical protein|uniref:hypothetical protein n=1 Tax=Pseudomonadaceae TaxID=135621 RepID=UPI00130525F1|nr:MULTISPECIES: hypothetical protein [Pseudomonadaceae]MDH0214563.1 hypothetical protein [Stutzerimonas stutzeri]MDH0261898.1 hypothetical protein [Stutzerimonas stutzeri]MDI9730267.1 hypothetical protein [Stutzerimonas stutzeri]MDI9750288.1 hypothetical protein [Stutzerimonas stutzeri]QPI11899.1 hypothetical protein IM687_21440 [Stutzerimonas stutzeri]
MIPVFELWQIAFFAGSIGMVVMVVVVMDGLASVHLVTTTMAVKGLIGVAP